ncbi:hypothetical protein [Reyranella soli]|uniref:Uncharacterized protein n=1 Tax=Reyranella soli TaxID=1230389 RepID=A0A512NQ20_9HYPH|nr:hypothetical protein [Reyranella soli]GEP61041.1 hypothetical protein RSO01_82070 [Reyranella soli]
MLTKKNIEVLQAELEKALTLELICGSALPADYRRDLLRRELENLPDSKANDFLDRVLGGIGHDDPLVVLMQR